jgi:hypothetical protein
MREHAHIGLTSAANSKASKIIIDLTGFATLHIQLPQG